MNTKLNIRNFIKWSIASTTYLFISWYTTKIMAKYEDQINDVIVETDKETNIINDETEKKIDKTKELIWEFEYEFFLNFFLSGYETYWYNEILKKIKKIQKENGLKIDWIIWKKTLKILYVNYYSKDIEKLDYEILLRLEIYNEMSKYKDKKRNHPKHWILRASWVPDVFNNKYYHWRLWTQNLEWSFIDNSLYNKVEKYIDKKWNNAYLKKIDWKFVVILYIDWNLKLASYTSPWNPKLKWAKNTIKWNFKSILKKYSYREMYHISWADASVKNGRWAIMPYAVHVTWWTFAHAWNVNWGKLSHGCIRIPLLYAKGLFSFFMKYWDINWEIKDTK